MSLMQSDHSCSGWSGLPYGERRVQSALSMHALRSSEYDALHVSIVSTGWMDGRRAVRTPRGGALTCQELFVRD
jgi:hypothetical protein